VFCPETDGYIRCSLRGKFKNDLKLKKDKLVLTDIAVVGDRVDFQLNEESSGVIETIQERNSFLSRKAPKIKGAGLKGERLEQVIASNLDALYIIVSTDQPAFNNKTLDRFLIVGESSGLQTKIVLNKTDLIFADEFDEIISLYQSIGYEVFPCSTKTGDGLEKLKKSLVGKTSLFWGPSGVGKSSILTAMCPSLDLETGTISAFHNKGKHTTVTVWMHHVEKNTFIIDTPGVREIEPYGIKKEDLGHYFPEFVPFINECRYNTCTHDHEPGCAIVQAVEEEIISGERYDSYLRILATTKEEGRF
jgi:ribosome biogenesis GTPase / thiamine phosphate phosphatase